MPQEHCYMDNKANLEVNVTIMIEEKCISQAIIPLKVVGIDNSKWISTDKR